MHCYGIFPINASNVEWWSECFKLKALSCSLFRYFGICCKSSVSAYIHTFTIRSMRNLKTQKVLFKTVSRLTLTYTNTRIKLVFNGVSLSPWNETPPRFYQTALQVILPLLIRPPCLIYSNWAGWNRIWVIRSAGTDFGRRVLTD